MSFCPRVLGASISQIVGAFSPSWTARSHAAVWKCSDYPAFGAYTSYMRIQGVCAYAVSKYILWVLIELTLISARGIANKEEGVYV